MSGVLAAGQYQQIGSLREFVARPQQTGLQPRFGECKLSLFHQDVHFATNTARSASACSSNALTTQLIMTGHPGRSAAELHGRPTQQSRCHAACVSRRRLSLHVTSAAAPAEAGAAAQRLQDLDLIPVINLQVHRAEPHPAMNPLSCSQV